MNFILSDLPKYSSIVLAGLVILSFALQGKARDITRKVLLGVATLVVVNFYASMIQPSLEKNQTAVAATRTEVPLKFQSIVNVGASKAYQTLFPPKPNEKQRIVQVAMASLGPLVKTSAKALEDFVKDSPDPPVTKAKLAVVLSANKKNDDDQQKAKDLVEKLSSSTVAREQLIGKSLQASLFAGTASPDEVKEYGDCIEHTFTPGWFREYALLELYRKHSPDRYEQLADMIEATYYQSFSRCAVMFGTAVLGFFVGLVVLVVQFGSIARRDSEKTGEGEKPALNISLGTAFSALVAWQAIEVVIGQLLKLLPAGALKSFGTSGPLALSVLLLITYLINMGPAVLCIYFMVLRPREMSFMEDLRIRFKTSRAGLGRLFLGGVLSWCACIPLVVLASIASAYMGSKGSDNPVLAQIVSASKTPDTLAIGLLFLTIAVLAPLFEEVIFRGFLYGVLRKNLGTFAALFGSAFVFAAIHLDKGGMVPLFAIGLALALCYERNRSLVPCFIAHGMWNGGTLLLNLVLFS